jgi:hypothetical protein
LEKNQKNFKILLAFLRGLSYNKYTEVVKSGAKCFDVVEKSMKIGKSHEKVSRNTSENDQKGAEKDAFRRV